MGRIDEIRHSLVIRDTIRYPDDILFLLDLVSEAADIIRLLAYHTPTGDNTDKWLRVEEWLEVARPSTKSQPSVPGAMSRSHKHKINRTLDDGYTCSEVAEALGLHTSDVRKYALESRSPSFVV